MRALLLTLVAMVNLVCSLPLLAQTESGERIVQPVVTRVAPADTTTTERAALKGRETALHKLMGFYNFEPKTPWSFEVVRCPAIAKHVIVDFTSVEMSEGSSQFIAILPEQDGRIRLVPLWYRGLRSFETPYSDPHNIAIFNETMAQEAAHLKSEGDWLQLAVCYLGMVGESPNLLLPTNIRRHLGAVTQEEAERILPVVAISKSFVEVGFYDAREKAQFSEWHLTFGVAGQLREVTRENHDKSELLKP